jgi:hypothetical protein
LTVSLEILPSAQRQRQDCLHWLLRALRALI